MAPVEKKKNGIVQGTLYNAETGIKSEKVFNEKEQEILQWVLKNRKRAGAMTERFSEEPYLYLSIYAAQNRYGVIGIFIGQKPLDVFENSILLSILGECAMALDREQSALSMGSSGLTLSPGQRCAGITTLHLHRSNLRVPTG